MGDTTPIEWCDSTINPVMGCDGCELWLPGEGKEKHCYAGVMHERYGGQSKGYAKDFTKPEIFPGRMGAAAKWRDLRGQVREDKPWIPKEMPRLVFISDMGDALSKGIPFEYLKTEIVDVVSGWKHIGIWLTKRPSRMAEFDRWLAGQGVEWPANLWAMTSVTDERTADARIPELLKVRAPVRGVSAEPMLGPIDFDGHVNAGDEWHCGYCGGFTGDGDHDCYFPNYGIHWVIFGGESGPGARPCNLEWIRDGVAQCRDAGVKVFVKQLGAKPFLTCLTGYDGPATDCELKDPKGGDMSEWPEDLRIREFPETILAGPDTRIDDRSPMASGLLIPSAGRQSHGPANSI